MAEFYRFRSIDALLGKHRELEEQTIYFASPEELNDPMEGLRDIVWNGDEIVWTNFFKHYIFCLNRCYLPLKITPNPGKLDAGDIPILERWDEIATPIEKILFNDIWDRFCNLPHIPEIIETLSNIRRKIRYREIVFYLRSIQIQVLLDAILKSYNNHKLIPKYEGFRQWSENSRSLAMKQLLDNIKQTEKVGDEHALDAMFHAFDGENAKIRRTLKNNATSRLAKSGEIDLTVTHDFPKVYVEQLDRLLWENWYTACFTESYHNSSVWATYADGHKGACLIFEAVEEDGSKNLKLNWGKSSTTLAFREVNYADRPGEIDFFRTIARMRGTHFRELWYTDQDGKTSECASHIGSDRSEDAWQADYWNNFYRDVTFKTKDWEYEQEYRLILTSPDIFNNVKVPRKLTYNFDSLKGIIFGMRTSTEDKIKIIEIIKEKKKCPENNQADFKFFEAYYSSKDGGIRVREIQLG
ncbi:MAG: DUF2971 domain-containing protein [Candidatus Poribacteria bacterium]|nr:DUF2971 domain-containing protein [Candidatus Poribacteria bacterium]